MNLRFNLLPFFILVVVFLVGIGAAIGWVLA